MAVTVARRACSATQRRRQGVRDGLCGRRWALCAHPCRSPCHGGGSRERLSAVQRAAAVKGQCKATHIWFGSMPHHASNLLVHEPVCGGGRLMSPTSTRGGLLRGSLTRRCGARLPCERGGGWPASSLQTHATGEARGEGGAAACRAHRPGCCHAGPAAHTSSRVRA